LLLIGHLDFPSLEISRAKSAWEAAQGENVFKNEQNRLNDKFLGL
jgi:hypothetical protein